MEQKKKSRYTEAQARSAKKYQATKADMRTWTTPEQKELFKAAAEKENKSLNQFVIDCILEHIEKTN